MPKSAAVALTFLLGVAAGIGVARGKHHPTVAPGQSTPDYPTQVAVSSFRLGEPADTRQFRVLSVSTPGRRVELAVPTGRPKTIISLGDTVLCVEPADE